MGTNFGCRDAIYRVSTIIVIYRVSTIIVVYPVSTSIARYRVSKIFCLLFAREVHHNQLAYK